MGMFKVKVKVANPADSSRFFEGEFWVDTGSLYTFIPEDRLETIGIEPTLTREFTLADGRRDRRLLGEALITIPELRETLTNQIIFGPKDSLFLLGATTLEAFSVEPDPVAKKLKPVAAIIGAHFDSR
ncbi:MAG: Retroviral aspartyl protease [Bacteroidetes bacterium]|nr:Retroviral aspartyl protease [Bacteroidota bacterium]